MPAKEGERRRFAGIDALRGIAALSVCYYHFVVGSPAFLAETSLLRRAGDYAGPYGVFIFFIISGFIIPLSLARSCYRLGDAPRYLLRRIARIDPPYLFSLLLELAVMALLMRLPNYHGGSYPRWYEILGHVGYLNGVLGWPWLIPVYWTLAIEFQYYLCVSLCFPLIFSRSRMVSVLTILLWSGSGLVLPSPVFVFRYGALFALGFVLCRHLERRSQWPETLVLVSLALGNVGYTFGWPCVPTALLTMAGIAFWKNPSAGWLFFGKISYSLYLIHAVIGFHLVNGIIKFSGVRHAGPLLAWPIIGLGFLSTIPAAWLFWRYVEWPFHLLAQRIPVSTTKHGDAGGKP